MAKHSLANPTPWKTLVLGVLLGWVAACFFNGGGNEQVSHGRILEEAAGSADGAEGHHGESEEEEEEHEARVMDTTVTAIVLFLIVLTILFEEMKESIEEEADRVMQPVIEGLFGELTVLGFLSVVTFCVTKLGWFETLSERIFGEEEEEELLETFEVVHFMLFFIMVFFVINVLVLVRGANKIKRKWWVFNAACQDEKYMERLDNILKSHSAAQEETTYFRYFLNELLPFRSPKRKFRAELTLFRGLRHEFVIERSLEPPFDPHAENFVPDDFDFGRYLNNCMAHELGHIVHLKIATWAFLAVVTAFYYVLALFVEGQLETFTWIWVATGWIFFLLGSYFDFHMVKILEGMAANLRSKEDECNSERGSLLPDSPALPRWTKIDLKDYIENGRSMLVRFLVPSNTKIARPDALYWFERKGPKYYMIIFQVQMVFTAAYTSLLLGIMFPYMYENSEQSTSERVLFLFLSLCPIFLLFSKYQNAVANYTMASSIGVHRRPHTISQVIREEKVSRVIRAMVTMQKLQHAASVGFSVGPNDRFSRSSKNTKGVTYSELDVEASGRTFDALDLSGDGSIETAELAAVLKSLGANVTEESLKAMTYLLDENEDGSISREEFMNFYRTHIIVDLDSHGIHELGKTMFHQIDADGSGEITLSEFKEVLDSFNVGFSVDEIGDLINELDQDDNGTIGEHEFVKLLQNHNLLFERIPLPDLE